MAETRRETGRQGRQPAGQGGGNASGMMPRAAMAEADEALDEQKDTMHEAGHKVERLGQRQGEQMKETAGAAAEASERLAAGGADALSRSGTALAQGLQDFGRIWVEFAQDTMKQSIEATETLLRCRTFGDIMQVQSEYMRNSLDTVLDQSARMSDISARIIAETTAPMARFAGRDREETERSARL